MARVEVELARKSRQGDRFPGFPLLVDLARRPDFALSAVVGTLVLALAYYWLLLRETTIHTMIGKLGGDPIYLVLLGAFALSVLLLFGLNAAVTALLLRAQAGAASQGGSLLGVLIGGFGVGCPSCGAFLLSLVGVSAGLSALPFGGLELWFFSGLAMAFTLSRSLRSLRIGACAATGLGSACVRLPPVSRTQIGFLGAAAVLLVCALVWLIGTHDGFSVLELS